jgi:hypothetical protein
LRLYSDILHVVFDAIALGRNLFRSRGALAAENLFLRKQLTFFVEREQTPPAIFPSIRDLTLTTFRSDGASSRRQFLVACTTITGSTLPLERGSRPQ